MRVFYAQAVYDEREIEAVVAVLKNSPLTLMDGPQVAEFESRVADLFGKRHGLMVNSGSSANTLAVAALRLPAQSEVITPALTFSTTVAPLIQQQLVPALVDVEADTFNIDADRVEAMIGPKTRAMMVPNLIGNLPNWNRLREIADAHGLALIEDSADTIGSTYRGRPTGALSDLATTSFYASHVVTAAGFGGLVMADDEDLINRMRLLRGWGRSSSLLGESERPEDRFEVELDGIEYDAKFLFSAVGYNFLPSEIAAAFGLVQLDRLEEYSNRRRANFDELLRYFGRFEDWFVLPRQNADAETPWLAFPLVVRGSAPFTRRMMQTHLESDGIQTRVVFTGNILRQPGFSTMEHRKAPEGYPNADHVSRGGVLLGTHQGMTADQLGYICESFDAFAARF